MKRFSVYFAPPKDSPLSRIAASWLGRDASAFSGHAPVDPPRNGFSREVWRASTSDPRRYGFHATLKPPFRLRSTAREEELIEQARAFSRQHKSFFAPPLEVSSVASFHALTLSEPCPAFQALAAACVRDFDHFRATPDEEELARRLRSKLSAKHCEYLDQWGYPYVMDEWRFHMTLTSSLAPRLFEQMGEHLKNLFSPYCGEPLPVDSICLFEQIDLAEPFNLLERFHLL